MAILLLLGLLALKGPALATGEAGAPAASVLHDCDAPDGTLLTDTVKSAVLGVSLPVNVYLPPCYDADRYAYPTLYLIQGLGYDMGQWVDDGVTSVAAQQIASGQLPPFIIVMPANDLASGNGSRFVYTRGGPGSWEDFIANELVPATDTHYSTWRDRDGRAIGGISRGGFWSLEIAFTHPDLFGAVGGHSPAITTDYLLSAQDGFSMLDLAHSTDSLGKLRIFLDAGSEDSALDGVYQLASELGTQHITYTSRISTGNHSDVYWSSQIPAYLAFYASAWPLTPRSK